MYRLGARVLRNSRFRLSDFAEHSHKHLEAKGLEGLEAVIPPQSAASSGVP